MMVPLPSYSGKRLVKARAPVSLLGCSDHSGKAIIVEASDASSAGGKADEDEVGCIDAADASMFHGDLWQIGGTVARWQNLIPPSTLAQSKERKGSNFAAQRSGAIVLQA